MQPESSNKNQEDTERNIESARAALESDPARALAQSENLLATLGPADDRRRGAVLLIAGRACHLLDRHEQALDALRQAHALFERGGDSVSAVQAADAIAAVCMDTGNYEEAHERWVSVLGFWKQHNDLEQTAHGCMRLGRLFSALSEYNKAIEQYSEALRLFEGLNDLKQSALVCLRIGECYAGANEMDAARHYLNQALATAHELGDPSMKAMPLGVLATLYAKEKDYVRAMECFRQAIDILNITGDDSARAVNLIGLGSLYLDLGQHDKALGLLEDALGLFSNQRTGIPAEPLYRNLSRACASAGRHEEALAHLQEAVRLQDERQAREASLKSGGLWLRHDLEELRSQKEMAEQKSRLNDRFLSGISHELRTSLNGIEGMVNLLAETRPTPEQLDYISTIRLSANNLLVIISDLLDYSRISEGAIDFEKQEFKLKEHLAGLIQMLKAKTDEKNLRLSLQLDKNLPDKVMGDPMRLNQILFNLLNNAVKFTEKGSVTLVVQVVKQEKDRVRLLFQVSDSGIGITEEQLPYIFEKFAYARFFPGNQHGTGIGLSLVKSLVERQGGTVTVSSRVGEGSVFSVELEYAITPAAEPRKPGRGKKQVLPVDLSDTTVLLVEDNKVNQFLARQLLTKMGLRVTVAGSAESALEQLKGSVFDIILMDVQMPGMNGYELSRHIRSSLPAPQNEVPIIAITAYVSPADKETALASGMVDYVTKPYSPQELLSVILKHLPGGKGTGSASPAEKKKSAEPELIRSLLDLMGGSKTDLVDLIEVLVSQTPVMNDELCAHLTAKNWKKAFHAAHKLKSSVRILNSNELNGLIGKIEENTSSLRNLESVESLFSEYATLCNGFIERLKTALPELKK